MLKKIVFYSCLSFLNFLLLFKFQFKQTTLFQLPNVYWIPIGMVFYSLLINYFLFILKSSTTIFKITSIIINVILITFLLKIGFEFWSINRGNLTQSTQLQFQYNFSNLTFWIQYQTILIALALHSFKTIITFDQKN